ncbi:MAG: hypothetical protein F4W92_09320 [Gammaproteobacteria bacterium]|nr:hypothetical protein [Gammaproteobacteria bacterium]
MNSIKLLVLTIIATLFVISTGAHPGPERHPIEQELTDLATELRSHINELERRLNARIDGLAAPDEEAISVVVESTVNAALVGITQSSDELKNQVDELVATDRQHMYYGLGALAVLLVGFIGMFAYFQVKLKT